MFERSRIDHDKSILLEEIRERAGRTDPTGTERMSGKDPGQYAPDRIEALFLPIDLKKASDWPFEEEVPLTSLSDEERLLHEIYIAYGKLKLENITAAEAKQDLFKILIYLQGHKALVKRYNDINGDDYHTRLFYIAHLEEDAKRSLEGVYSSMIDIIKYGWLEYNDIYSNIIRILRMILDTSLEDIIYE